MVKKICLQCRRPMFSPWVGKISWKRERLPTPVSKSGEFHRERSLAGYSPWDHKELDKTERQTQPKGLENYMSYTFKSLRRVSGP